MKRPFAVALVVSSAVILTGVGAAQKQAPSSEVQRQLIALDKQWGEAGGNTATLDKILGDNILSIGPNGEAQGKQEQIAASKSGPSTAPGSYVADEHKLEMLGPDVVVMTHRGTTTTVEGGKQVKESHRSLHVFQRRGANWQVVANAQVPIPAANQ